jgi:hypothetical protein
MLEIHCPICEELLAFNSNKSRTDYDVYTHACGDFEISIFDHSRCTFPSITTELICKYKYSDKNCVRQFIYSNGCILCLEKYMSSNLLYRKELRANPEDIKKLYTIASNFDSYINSFSFL